MTIQSSTSRATYAGDNVSTVFPVPFLFFANVDITAVKTAAGGAVTTLVLNVDYTLTGAGIPAGGTLTKTTALLTGETLGIFLDPPRTQLSHYLTNDIFPAATLETNIDRSVQISQRLYDLISRAIRAPDSDNNPQLTLPSAVSRALKYITFDASGNLSVATSLPSGTLSQASIGAFLYPQTTAEAAASVTPANYANEYNLVRYGADVTGVADSTAAINRAINAAVAAGGRGIIWHPGGTIMHASQITVPNGITIQGWDRTACLFNYTGSAASSAWRNVNAINSSGFGRVIFRNVGITTAVASSTAAGIELNAGGFSFYEIDTCRVTGTFKYGIICDGIEVSHLHHNIVDNGGVAGGINIWLVNGADRSAGQTLGFTNSITINDNQLNISGSGTCNIADDGGSNHNILNNNCNGAHVPIVMCSVQGFTLLGQEIENALAGGATGNANILFTNVGKVSGAVKGPCQAGKVAGNFLGADMGAGSSSLVFAGAMHQGIQVTENWFRNNSGRVADIDVTKLSNGLCAQNYAGAPGGAHYTGVHNDADGNVLWPPQNGYAGGFAQNAYLWGDTRYRHWFQTGIQLTKIVVPYSAAMTFDVRQGNTFQITANNATAFTINIPTGDGVNGNDGTLINVQIRNTGGGALGAVTWAAGFKLAGAWVSPGSGNNRSITFYRDEVTSVWYELYRTAADVPN